VAEACALVRRDGLFLILQRGPGWLWEGFWEFPTIHVSGADPACREEGQGGAVGLAEGVRRLTGVAVEVGPVVQTVRFTVTRHRVRLDAHEARGLGGEPTPAPGFLRAAWVSPEQLTEYPFGTSGRRLIGWLNRPVAGL
jgi:A/G-specific adenine glycosylase